MAKRQCDPTSGSIGPQTYLMGRNGQVVRYRATPSNPKTAAQVSARGILSDVARRWRILTEDQRSAWTGAALGVNSRPRLGSYGILTGEQLFCRINVALATFGSDEVDAPPAFPTFPALAPQGLVITNTAGVIALKLTCLGDPGDGTILRAAAPVSQGINRPPRVSIIGTCPATAAGSATITELYVAKFGVPPVKSKVFVSANQIVDGWEDPLVTFQDVVPAA